jgi:cytochrome P450
VAAFIPPYPPRLPQSPWPWQRLMLARQNFLAMWEEEAFELEFSSERVFMRKTFLCNSPDSVQFAFNLKNASFERKAPQMRHALEPLLGDGLFISDGDTWRQRRRMVAPILHTSRMAEFAPVMVDTAAEMRDRWARETSVDALAEMAHLTAEIICRTVFGRNLGREHAREVVEGFSDYQRTIGQIDILSYLGLPDWVPRWYSPAVRRAQQRIHRVLDGVIASYRAAKRDDEPSVIGHLLDARDDRGEPMSEQALRNEAAVLFMAGHETTANSLTWTWYLLSQAPDVEARLHAELDGVLGGRLPALADIERLPYTRAVFEEALRLYPPVPILPREALREETYRGEVIPKGSLLFVVPWLLHRHKKFWREPDAFMPERFLPGSAEPVSKFAYVPFSIGPRFCAGMFFGMTEAILCLATLAQRFQLQLQAGHDVKPVCRLTLRPDGGMPMTLHPRSTVDHPAPAADTARPSASCPFHHG